MVISPLLLDRYQLSMLDAYVQHGDTDTAVFEFFVRKLPDQRRFLLAAGLEQAVSFIEELQFTPADLDWLRSLGDFRPELLDYLERFRFSGDVFAMPEGTIFFRNEPILRVVAPLPEAQILETRLINLLHFQTVVASKAARMVLAAPGKTLIDFGLRRAHGSEAGLLAARASYIAGFRGTATLEAQRQFGIPSFGTMAHSFIEAHDDEAAAFERFASARPSNLTLLLDTYDTEAAARKVVTLAPRLEQAGIRLQGVRLDSGDLLALSRSVRAILDAAGLKAVRIMASGGLDEHDLMQLGRAGAPIDGYGIGTSLTTSSDAPALDCAYKLQEYAGLPRRKKSAGKATWPGRKQVWREFDELGQIREDTVSLEGESVDGVPLLVKVMESGKRLQAPPSLDQVRVHARAELDRLPAYLRELGPGQSLPVRIAPALERLAAETDRRLGI